MPGKPGQFCICINCQKDLFWCEDRPFRSEAEASHYREQQQHLAIIKQQAGEAIRRVRIAESQHRIDRRKQSTASLVAGAAKSGRVIAGALRKIFLVAKTIILIILWPFNQIRCLGEKRWAYIQKREREGIYMSERFYITDLDDEDDSPGKEDSETGVTEAAARAMVRKYEADPDAVLNLDDITTLSAESAAILSAHAGKLELGGLTSLSVEVAHALSQHEGFLSLSGLTTLSDEAAKALAQHEGCLSLDGLTTLSDEAAKALAQLKGGLGLIRLTTLSDAAAEALAQHEGILFLCGLTTLSDKAAKALRSHPEVILPHKFKP